MLNSSVANVCVLSMICKYCPLLWTRIMDADWRLMLFLTTDDFFEDPGLAVVGGFVYEYVSTSQMS